MTTTYYCTQCGHKGWNHEGNCENCGDVAPVRHTLTRDEERQKAHDETGKCAFDAIKKMVDALNATDRTDKIGSHEWDRKREAAEQTIHEDQLSVLVRDGWHEPGAVGEGPEEYEILLSTGGPATRIIGKLSQYNEPETARLEVQDWFVPWQEWRGDGWSEDTLLDYARCFYFGE